MASRAESRVFTIQEANQALKELRRTLPVLRRALHDIETLEDRLEVLALICNRAVSSENPDLQEYLSARVRYHRAIAQFEGMLADADSEGYMLRDLEKGVVHFTGKHGGKSVLLCWREGEKEIRHWHPLDGDALPDETRRNRIREHDDF